MNAIVINYLPTVSALLPKIRWLLVIALLAACLAAPQFAQACGINGGGGCGG